MLASSFAEQFFKRLSTIECGVLSVKTPDGKTRIFEGKVEGETANIEIYDWRVIGNLIRKGDIGFAEDYRDRKWDTDDLLALLVLGLENKAALNRLVMGNSFSRFISKLSYFLRLNSIKGSKKNIHAHYDLGNEFYKLWLDPTMTYSSAIYKEDDSLQNAQHNKYDRILECLEKRSGNLLEIGCGWGGFANRAQESGGDFGIKGITLSEQQHSYATQKLGDKANIVLEDYRHQSGKFDHIVSIEMFEAVGEKYWNTYFSKIKDLLNVGGKAVIQTITIDENDFENYRRGGDFIRSYIFPGGMLPSHSRFKRDLENAGLKTHNAFCFGQDYARTLTQWLNTFDKKTKEVQALGFDDAFIRLWRFYLAACAAGFKTRRTDVMQIELSHA